MITTFSAKAGAVLIISHEKCLYSYIFYVYIMPSTWLQTPKSQKCVISSECGLMGVNTIFKQPWLPVKFYVLCSGRNVQTWCFIHVTFSHPHWLPSLLYDASSDISLELKATVSPNTAAQSGALRLWHCRYPSSVSSWSPPQLQE